MFSISKNSRIRDINEKSEKKLNLMELPIDKLLLKIIYKKDSTYFQECLISRIFRIALNLKLVLYYKYFTVCTVKSLHILVEISTATLYIEHAN